ncbi:MAG TPA: glucoamylase family protein, partial [Byssovorax sp.]
MAGAMAHPLNRPVLDDTGTRVVRGYGVVQPRVGATLSSTTRSTYARAYAGCAGVDPYTTAVSDVYQDLFGEGVYVGKALYDVDAFEAALAGRVPESALLSHDLFEGIHARAALATDIEVLDDQPTSYREHTARQHRWVRGDWQLLPWLLGQVPARGGVRRPNDMSTISRWKLLDNLRRSLIAPSIVALLTLAWIAAPRTALIWTIVSVLALGTPLIMRLGTELVRHGIGASKTAWGDLDSNALQLGFACAFLLDQAILMVDAITRTLVRLVTRRRLLEWETASEARRRVAARKTPRRMVYASAASLALGAAVALRDARTLAFAGPILLGWMLAPVVASVTSRRRHAREAPLSELDRRWLRTVARKTWRFFETFVTPGDHALPPDNYQEDPKGVLARRTSPTNIGLYLLATVSARDFGFITLEEEASRLECTLDTIDKLEHHAGHVLNWYDTSTLAPLAPRYVSTVDSGNLAAHLWTVASACREVADAPIVSTSILEAALDAAHALEEAHAAEAEAAPEELARLGLCIDDVHRLASVVSAAVASPPKGLSAWRACLDACIDAAAKVDASVALGDPTAEISVRAKTPGAPASTRADDVRFWAGRAVRGLTHARDELLSFAPWAARGGADAAIEADSTAAKLAHAIEGCTTLRDLERLPAIADPLVADVERALASKPAPFRTASEERFGDARGEVRAASERAATTTRRFEVLADRATARADGMRFDMLYDPRRKLFAIGYDVGSGRLDSSYYDLLASEARLASLVAIAKGDVPQEHWFRLGRQLTATPAGRTLVSWSGSMFEYLMPLLVTRDYDETLLHETYRAVILWQREYAARKGTPWGVSECAYNLLDLGLTYQYRAFGAPGLGFKAGLGDDLVIAPYATALAALVVPALATENLRALAKEGLEGAYGFFDAIDYTPERVPPGHRGVVVKVFMAHHQGMSLVALGGALDAHPMRRRFHADPRVKATALLLQERVPVAPALTRTRADDGAAASPIDAAEESIDVVTTPLGPTRAHLLGNGEFSAMITASGSGWTTWRDLDVTRYREDGALDAWGSFCYLRDVDTGVVWSTAYQPSRRAPDAYEVTFAIDRVTIHRVDGELQSTTEIVTGCEHAA